ncbi:hypothetical protein BKA65DRAFT_490174 [Rhexocercosporidium sp. MPI-PUGE-AT-0058]|nr:hypothetical protein BKA65DRAFT_490174 [Rhexocercosporidium sp. MPI-PUGE-AT-0058]
MQNQGKGLLHTLVSASRDVDLGMSRYDSFPFVQDETAKSHLLRIMDFWNTNRWDDTSTNAICKEVTLTLLQCAARLYEDKAHTKAAVDLIESSYTREILGLGFHDILCQRYEAGITPNKLEESNAKNYLRKADRFSAIRKSKDRELDYQAMIFEHISSLCRFHSATLQNSFDSPRIDEHFMFHNYAILSKTFNCDEKSWLITLLPNTFQWDGQDPSATSGGDRLLADNIVASKETNQEPIAQQSSPPELERFSDFCPLIADGEVKFVRCQATTNEQNEWWAPYEDLRIRNSDSDFKSLTPTSKDLERKKGIDPSRKRAVSYPESSTRAVTSILNAPYKSYDDLTSQTEEIGPVGIEIQRDNGDRYHKDLREGLLSPHPGVPDDDWTFLESDDDSEIIFPFSLGSSNDTANRALVPTVLHGANNARYSRVPSAKDSQLALSTSVLSLPLRNKYSQRPPQFLSEWMIGHRNKSELRTISEEPEGPPEVD